MKPTRHHIDQLLAVEPIKVWSLIVTLFGYRGRVRPVTFSGKDLRDLFVHIGIKPEAIRVALHRLKKDGWIVTSRDGRETLYSLSKDGLAQTKTASKDVYRPDVKYPDGWKLIIRSDDTADTKASRLSAFRNVEWVPINHTSNDATAQMMEVDCDLQQIPEWFLERVVPASLEQTARAYVHATQNLKEAMHHAYASERFTMQLLALHHWRKMALRDSTWFHIWLMPDGAFAQSHKNICAILEGAPEMYGQSA